MRRSLAVAATVAAATLAAPALASASQAVDLNQNNPIGSGSVSIGGYSITGSLGDVGSLDVDVATKAKWSGNLWTSTGWDTGALRQASPLTVSRSTILQTGTMHVTWSLSGSVNPLGSGSKSIGALAFSDDADCAPAVSGANFDCVATSPSITLLKTPGLPLSPYIKLVLKSRFTVTPEGIVASRTYAVGGDVESVANGLALTQAAKAETLDVGCSPAGWNGTYRLGTLHYTPAVTATQQPYVQAGFLDPIGVFEQPAVYDKAFGPAIKTTPAFDLSGAGHTTNLGALLHNLTPPVIDVPAYFNGIHNQPISFHVNSVDAKCGYNLEYHFANGYVLYGNTPSRSFSPGVYDGEVWATDLTGLTSKAPFKVVVI
jgi:hypothetical protein